jgi:hypothetical protein
VTPNRRLLRLTIASGLLGAGIMLAFEAPVARIAGVALLFCFIVSGVFLVGVAGP